MWQCPTCNEVHEDSFDSCWKCAGVEAGAYPNDSAEPGDSPAPGVADASQDKPGELGTEQPGGRFRWRLQFSLSTLLAAFVVAAVLLGLLTGRLKIQNEQPAHILNVAGLNVYQWESKRPIHSCRFVVNGEQIGGVGAAKGPRAYLVTLAVAESDDRMEFFLRLGDESTKLTTPKRPNDSYTQGFSSSRSLDVNGPTQVYRLGDDDNTVPGHPVAKVTLVVE